jgi:HTH-like domain
VIRFITEHKDHQVPGPDGGAGLRWGVEPMCAVLTEHGVPISASTYYEWMTKSPTRRQLREAEVVAIITAQRKDKKTGKFVQTLGSRKMWIRLRGQGQDVGRCTVERIVREQGWEVHGTGPSTRPRSPTACIRGIPIASTATSAHRPRIGCGWLTLRMCRRGVGSSMSRLLSKRSVAGS